ncbi:MAG: dTDP-4-dehydrorhamnose reductase [Syntrophobacteraceae bacterium]
MKSPDTLKCEQQASKARQVVVIGAQGMLGRDLVASLHEAGLRATGLDMPELDITKAEETITSIRNTSAGIVVNCAAYTAVDKAESESEAAFAVNRDGAGNLALACKQLRIPLIHLSTDYVFDGSAKRPYRENDPTKPLGIYGMSKWEGEEAVRSRIDEHIILRTSWLFGIHGQNFVKTIFRLAREREELRVVSDQYGCPTWTGDLVAAIVRMSEQILSHQSTPQWGTYHYCGNVKTSWYDFALAIVEECRRRESLKVKHLLPITTAEYPLPAPRPAWSVLDCRKIRSAFGIETRSWRIGLAKVIEGICRAVHE